MVDYEFVKDVTGGADSSVGTEVACAMDPSGSKVYVYRSRFGTGFGSGLGTIRSYDWPNLDNETTVYTEPALEDFTGWRLCGVAYTPNTGVIAVVASQADGTPQIRDVNDNVLWTSPVTAASVTGGGAVWNSITSRLYVWITNGSRLYSMDEDGTNVVLEISGVAGTSILVVPPRMIVASDGALWWNSQGGPCRWTVADGPVTAGVTSNPRSACPTLHPGDPGNDVLMSTPTDTSTNPDTWQTFQYHWNGATIDWHSPLILPPPDPPTWWTSPTMFDGWINAHSASNADFTRGVAVAHEPFGPEVEDSRWWRWESSVVPPSWVDPGPSSIRLYRRRR